MRDELDAVLRDYNEGLSEFTFANLFLFRCLHNYRVSTAGNEVLIIAGNDGGNPFFILPAKLPETALLNELFREHRGMKCVSETKQAVLCSRGYTVTEDRNNFDYLYFRDDLSRLPGKKFHKKRNLLSGFLNSYSCEGRPLEESNRGDAFSVLERWQEAIGEVGDFTETTEALKLFHELRLSGAVYYIDAKPAAFVLGEPLVEKLSFVIHFEKADTAFRGIYQFVNKAFAAVLPKKYIYVNREQDLGDDGLRQAKMTYRPCSFVKKYRVTP